jgi:membrane protein
MQRLKRYSLSVWNAAKRFYLEDFTYSASALAFTTLLALVPIVSVILSLLAMFPEFKQVIDVAQNYLLTNFLPASGETLRYYLQNFTLQATRLPIVGIFFLFITATMLIITVENTLNNIWGVPQRKKKFSAWLLYWLVLIVVPFAIGCSVFLSTLFLSLPWWSDPTINSFMKPSVFALLSLIIDTVMFSLLYIILPNFRVGIWNGFAGGLLAAVLFGIAKKLFAFYIHQFPSYELIYGTLATIPIFLLWVYISWMILLFGALFTNEQYKLLAAKKKKS